MSKAKVQQRQTKLTTFHISITCDEKSSENVAQYISALRDETLAVQKRCRITRELWNIRSWITQDH